ncbi:uncharacterized protein N7518_005381 [Penicillium psychrosexuale]|uniref:uncharacterized protein n=1 Tax=Penicillium psychrosexuale TaxID=1002107 RepID=UPI0025452019|nr:uncharacterized protein N7518_005381 [Penicillium psychrosexuale]KAJ5796841.1 hypothetical protein N7518_005381 [Penicillium psychrosexuale]
MGKKKGVRVGVRVGQVEALHATQPGTKHPIESSKVIPEEKKTSAFGSDAELEKSLNKFFGGPPFFLILPNTIKGHAKPSTGKRACKGRWHPFVVVTWMDVLSEATTASQFQRQENGMYRCHVKGRLIEMSAENYHFIALGYPQRMMNSSYLSEAQRGQEAAGFVGEQAANPFNTGVNQPLNSVPDPMDMTRSSIADLSHQTEKSTMVSYQNERDIKETSHVAEEFQTETTRLRPNRRQVSLQSRRKQGFSGRTPILMANNPVRSDDNPVKSNVPTHIDDGGAGSLDIPKHSSPSRRLFPPWTPSPKKEWRVREGPVAPNTSPRAAPTIRYSSRELIEGPAFIKSLIEGGTSWKEQEELYQAEFGVFRSQFRLVKRFGLVDMKNWGFGKGAFKKSSRQLKSQSTSTNVERRESSPIEASQAIRRAREKKRDKGKKRDPGPSDPASNPNLDKRIETPPAGDRRNMSFGGDDTP